MPQIRETKGHLLTIEKVQRQLRNDDQNRSFNSGSSPKKGFKMKRFADVQGKITTNRPALKQRHNYADRLEDPQEPLLGAEVYATVDPPKAEPIMIEKPASEKPSNKNDGN